MAREGRTLRNPFLQIGLLDDACPSCGSALAKRPKQKTPCPHCGEFIYARKRAFDHEQVLVSEADRDALQREWEMNVTVRIYPQIYWQAAEVHRQRLSQKFHKPPSDQDVAWRHLANEAMRHAQEGQIGLYRNVRLSAAALLEQEGKLSRALEFYLWVCLLDAFTDGTQGLAMDTFAPGVFGKVRQLITALGLEEPEVRNLFLVHADEARLWRSATPVESAWVFFANAMYEDCD